MRSPQLYGGAPVLRPGREPIRARALAADDGTRLAEPTRRPGEGRLRRIPSARTAEARLLMKGHKTAVGPTGMAWLDGVTRDRLVDGTLARLAQRGVVSGAVLGTSGLRRVLGEKESVYQPQLHELALRGATPAEAVQEVAHVDALLACDQLRTTYERADGASGFVAASPPPHPDGGTETDAASALWSAVGRRNLLVSIPLGRGMPDVITAVVARGVSVHVTQVTSVERFQSVMDSIMSGLEHLLAGGRSVAGVNFAISVLTDTLDAEVDGRLAETRQVEHGEWPHGCAGRSTARLTFVAAGEVRKQARWRHLAAEGAVLPMLELGHLSYLTAPPEADHGVRQVLSVDEMTSALPLDEAVPPGSRGMAAGRGDCHEALADNGIDILEIYSQLEDRAARERAEDWAAIRGRVECCLAAVAEHDESAPRVVKSDAEWRAQLTPAEYRVLREAGTERAFTGEYTSLTTPGIYSCRGCGSALFGSGSKFDVHCGWPTFFSPVTDGAVTERADTSTGPRLTEVICSTCHSHLGHVFTGEGHNTPTDRRYCLNSTALHHMPQPREETD